MELICNRTLTLLVVLALSAALGVVMLFLGCALHFPGSDSSTVNWYGLFVSAKKAVRGGLVIFYLLSPIPLAIARKCAGAERLSAESSNLLFEICYFLSACVVVSGFGLPAVLARGHTIQAASAGLIAGANLFVFGTVYAYFIFFGREDEWDWTSGF